MLLLAALSFSKANRSTGTFTLGKFLHQAVKQSAIPLLKEIPKGTR